MSPPPLNLDRGHPLNPPHRPGHSVLLQPVCLSPSFANNLMIGFCRAGWEQLLRLDCLQELYSGSKWTISTMQLKLIKKTKKRKINVWTRLIERVPTTWKKSITKADSSRQNSSTSYLLQRRVDKVSSSLSDKQPELARKRVFTELRFKVGKTLFSPRRVDPLASIKKHHKRH